MNRLALLATLLICTAAVSSHGQAQKKPPVANSALCTRNIALDNAKQQILFSRTFDQPALRIAVLLRAADLIWPYEPDKASAAFMEAFDLAVQDFKENGDQLKRASERQFSAVIPAPDQRYKVLAVLAKRDPAKAREMSEKLLGKLDFDGSLAQATTFTDKSLRALTTLSVIEPCLESAPAKPTTRKSKF